MAREIIDSVEKLEAELDRVRAAQREFATYTQEQVDAMSEEEQLDAKNQMWRNFCVSDTFEPGSPSKVFTVSAALEENLVTPNTHFFCDGYQTIAGQIQIFGKLSVLAVSMPVLLALLDVIQNFLGA